MSKKKANTPPYFIIAIIVALLLVGTVLIKMNSRKANQISSNNQNPITMEAGKQIITVTAGNGYSPENITAKSNIPTVLVLKSDNAYGCERAFTIPSLNIERTLPINGEETFDLGTFKAGDSLFASCSMGMYTFTINFE